MANFAPTLCLKCPGVLFRHASRFGNAGQNDDSGRTISVSPLLASLPSTYSTSTVTVTQFLVFDYYFPGLKVSSILPWDRLFYYLIRSIKPIAMNLTIFTVVILSFVVGQNKSSAQTVEQNTSQIVIPGFPEYKKQRKVGKVFQLIGGLGLTTYFVLSKTHQNAVRNWPLDAKPPSLIIPIAASAVMTIGFSIDMGAVDHLFRRKRSTTRVSTENYQF